MPALFIELFSEEIPARLQARGADELLRLVTDALALLDPRDARVFYGPRRIAMAADIADRVVGVCAVERGPRTSAPEQALAGFMRKHGATKEDLRQEGDFWVLDRTSPTVDASTLIAGAMPGLLRRFAWPKSMRWGGTSAFTWIRPLRRIVCLLDSAVVPFSLATEGDDGHGLASGNLTEGHRLHGPGAFAVNGLDDWRDTLFEHRVMVGARARAGAIWQGLGRRASEKGVSVVEDAGLLEEIAGLVEWPVPLLGRIDDAFMDLPPEVMQVSMRVNQRYFATRTADDAPAPWFAFAANLEAPDAGAAIVAGNERVLRARFSDARHFWDLDRRTTLADRVAALDRVAFQAELGSQGARAQRLVRLAGVIAPLIGANAALAERAALLAKADLTTGMVGEFPELQGVMGGYYAQHDGEDVRVADAVREHYTPRGASDGVPSQPVSIAVALADKIDQLAAFFAIGQKPTGSGDPYALRRAAQGIVRIIRENRLRLPLRTPLLEAARSFHDDPNAPAEAVLAFIVERLRIQVKNDGGRHDVLAMIFASDDDDLTRSLTRMEAILPFLKTDDGANLLAAYRRAANITRIEGRKDGPHDGLADAAMLDDDAERTLYDALRATDRADALLHEERFAEAMGALAQLRAPIDQFFERVTVNVADDALRRNRLRLLNGFRASVDRVADFSLLEG